MIMILILEHLHFFFGQSCLCVTFTSWSTPSFGMLLSKLSNRNTHVCTSSIRMIRDAGVGVVNQMWTGLDRGRGVSKIPKFVRTSFMDDPLFKIPNLRQKINQRSKSQLNKDLTLKVRVFCSSSGLGGRSPAPLSPPSSSIKTLRNMVLT